MCAYCDCRSQPALSVGDAVRQVLAALAGHIWWEESDPFPAAALALSAASLGATR